MNAIRYTTPSLPFITNGVDLRNANVYTSAQIDALF